MKCSICKNEIPDDSQFCICCGSKIKQESFIRAESNEIIQFCTNCGSKLKPGAKFCVKCGKKFNNEDLKREIDIEESNNKKTEVEKLDSIVKEPEKIEFESKMQIVETQTRKNVMIPLTIFLTILLLIAGGLVYKILVSESEKNSKQTTMEMVENQVITTENDTVISTETTNEQITEQTSAEDIFAGVNCDLRSNSEVSFEGLVSNDKGNYLFQWNEGMSFGDYDISGNPIRLDNVNTAVIDTEELPEGIMDSINTNEKVKIIGDARIENGQIVIKTTEIYDSTGKDLTESFSLDDYIIPDSDTRLLTENDVEGLTLREINYAKNEIYARHGRMFDSKELQNYFKNKKWYEGTIIPTMFDKGGYLSTIESKNAAFLNDMEKEKGGPYQLDQ